MRSLLPLLLALAACADDPPSAVYDPVPRVEAVPAAAPPTTTSRTLLGVAAPARDAVLTPMRSGRVVHRRAEPGAAVDKGDALLELDAREARAQLTTARAAVDEAEAVLADARRTFERVSSLGDGASEAQKDSAATGVARAEAAVARARGQRDLAQVNLDEMTVRAPFAGEVVLLDPEEGESVAAGQPVARVVDASHLTVKVGLLEDEVRRVRPGETRVEVAAEGARWAGVLAKVAPAADPRTLQWDAELRLDDADLPAGSPVTVHLALPAPTAQALVPSAAVSDAGEVWVVEGEVVHRTTVTRRGDVDGGVLVDGLAPGTDVVRHAPDDLDDGDRIVRLDPDALR